MGLQAERELVLMALFDGCVIDYISERDVRTDRALNCVVEVMTNIKQQHVLLHAAEALREELAFDICWGAVLASTIFLVSICLVFGIFSLFLTVNMSFVILLIPVVGLGEQIFVVNTLPFFMRRRWLSPS